MSSRKSRFQSLVRSLSASVAERDGRVAERTIFRLQSRVDLFQKEASTSKKQARVGRRVLPPGAVTLEPNVERPIMGQGDPR